MNKRLILGIAALLPVSAFANGTAPFCVYSSGDPQCYYYTTQSCQSAARSLNGMCGPNTQQQPSQAQPVQQTSVMDIYKQSMGGIQASRRARQAQAAPGMQWTPGSTGPVGWDALALGVDATQGKATVIYQCNGTEGDIPLPGCVVVRVVPKP